MNENKGTSCERMAGMEGHGKRRRSKRKVKGGEGQMHTNKKRCPRSL